MLSAIFLPGLPAGARSDNAEWRLVRGEPETVQTAAGPGFCQGDSHVESRSYEVRALAVDPGGHLWVDTGAREEGLVGSIDPDGTNLLIRPGNLHVQGSGSPGARPPRPESGGLASDRRGGFFAVAGGNVVNVDARGTSLKVVAGQANTAPVPGSPPAGIDIAEGSPAGATRFGKILGIASDASGNLLVAEELAGKGSEFRVRFVNLGEAPRVLSGVSVLPGTVRTVAGGGKSTKDAVAARAFRFLARAPVLAVSENTLYLASMSGRGLRQESRLHQVNLGTERISSHGSLLEPGTVKLLLRSPSGKHPTKELFSRVSGLEAHEGSLYMADPEGDRVLRLNSGGRLSTFAGAGRGGKEGNGHPATKTKLHNPHDVKADNKGRVFIADRYAGQVRFVDEAGYIQAAPGRGVALSWRCEQRQESGLKRTFPDRARQFGIELSSRWMLSAGPQGDVWIASHGSPRIVRIRPNGSLSASNFPACRAAEGTKPVLCKKGGSKSSQSDVFPLDIEAGHQGIYLLDQATGSLSFYNVTNRRVRIHGLDVPARGAARISALLPEEKAEASSIMIASNSRRGTLIRFLRSSRAELPGNLSIIERDGQVTRLDLQGTGLVECCRGASAIESDQMGNLYLADGQTNRVWYLNLGKMPINVHGQNVQPGAAAVVAGGGGRPLTEGASALTVSLSRISGISVDVRSRAAYLALGEAHLVGKIDSAGRITTAVGSGNAGFNGDGLKALFTRLTSPKDVAVNSCGALYVADAGNDRVRRLGPTSCRGDKGGQ